MDDDQGNNPPPSLKDQLFLLDFVMRTYLGPDVFSDNPRCSASQRQAKGLSPYTSKNLGPSYLSVSQLESLYYYVLRNADSSLILEPSMLHLYIKGQMRSLEYSEYGQFTTYFPINIHEHKRYSPNHEIVKGIVLIDDPPICDLKEEDLKRFKCLSGIDCLKIGKMNSLCYQRRNQEGNENDENHPKSNEVTTISTRNDISLANFQGKEVVKALGTTSSGNVHSPPNSQATFERNKEGKENDRNEVRAGGSTFTRNDNSRANSQANSRASWERNKEVKKNDHNHSRSNEVTVAAGNTSAEDDNVAAKSPSPCMRSNEETVMGNITNGSGDSPSKTQETYIRKRQVNLFPLQEPEVEELTPRTSKKHKPTTTSLVTEEEEENMEEWVPNESLTLNGTAKKGISGPPVGVVDIGVSKTAYFFRVALPGVRRDYCQFSCEIESNGKVTLQGTTTGGKTIKRGWRVFQMNFQQLCPPGSFTLSFHLPGPVDPRLVSPNFKPDGVFEAVIVKHKSQQ